MADARRDGNQKALAAGSMSFGAKVNMALKGDLPSHYLGGGVDSSKSDELPSVHLPGGTVTETANDSNPGVLGEVHRQVIEALGPIQPEGGVINPGDGPSFQEFIKGLVSSNSDKSGSWKRKYQAILDHVDEEHMIIDDQEQSNGGEGEGSDVNGVEDEVTHPTHVEGVGVEDIN